MSRLFDRCCIAASLAASAGVGCGGAPRFADRPIVWHVDDARPIPEPEENEYLKVQYFADIFAMRRLDRALELRDHDRAGNTNALDEVPDSTWFENRIGRRQVTPAEIARGASAARPRPPLSITGAKVGGGNAGFIVVDASGTRYLIKFDRLENPEMQTGAAASVVRLFWAIGYHVPSDNVFVLRRDDLVFDPKASFKDELGNKHPFTSRELEEVLATSPRLPDGSYRALSSELLPGTPKGGLSPEGVRSDDPNDRVPHENRRELRGLRVFAAWLGHTDMKQDNTLDMYVDKNGRKFLQHYLIDFGETLGGHHGEKNRDEDGYEHYWDWQNQPRALVTFGLWKRPWEGRIKTRWPAVGAFAAADFDPEVWREAYPYFPFFETDEADSYWAAKIAMRFERRHIEAAVAEAKYSDPAAAAYVVDTIIARQHKIGRTYLEAVSPLDEFVIRPGALCGVDLGVRHRLASSGVIERVGDDSELRERVTVQPDGSFCMPIPSSDDYQVYRLRTRRGGGNDPRVAMQVHFRGGTAAHILGIIRREP
ncbi:MAG: hypothetical protein WKG00_07290 [Polyangiaceae bacterium]